MLLQLSEPSGIVEDGNGDDIFFSTNMTRPSNFENAVLLFSFS